MASLPILPTDRHHPARRQYCRAEIDMPDFYMADFSLMGLMVDDYERALQLLNDKNQPLKLTNAGVEYPFKHSAQLHDLVLFLAGRCRKIHDIALVLADQSPRDRRRKRNKAQRICASGSFNEK